MYIVMISSSKTEKKRRHHFHRYLHISLAANFLAPNVPIRSWYVANHRVEEGCFNDFLTKIVVALPHTSDDERFVGSSITIFLLLIFDREWIRFEGDHLSSNKSSEIMLSNAFPFLAGSWYDDWKFSFDTGSHHKMSNTFTRINDQPTCLLSTQIGTWYRAAVFTVVILQMVGIRSMFTIFWLLLLFLTQKHVGTLKFWGFRELFSVSVENYDLPVRLISIQLQCLRDNWQLSFCFHCT